MNIAIVTLPLTNNYGGLLQNFAMQQILRKLGHNTITIDIKAKSNTPLWLFFCSWIKTILLYFIPRKRRKFAKFVLYYHRKKWSADFMSSFVKTTQMFKRLEKKIILDYRIDGIVVGSDQVWRPKYNCRLEDMFLKFAERIPIKRVAYAASFGVDRWEYTFKQSCACSRLAKKFDAVSVREESGVKLCKEHLGVCASWVLDPTLILAKEDYLQICKNVPICKEKYLAVYVLDENEQVTASYEREAEKRGLTIKKFYADSESTLTLPMWLSMFRDASFVVTDSFHGTVFSIIFGKEFKCIYNESRGAARFESLLKLYNSGKLDEMREFSLNWLKNALES